ncbi:hypothetical protein NEMBOFW57_004442 [Staphylotrichum longicolle]|uniref:Uncharacterized protein n=1 Tax=Staphylotrichum longicolle TaxID=669026 RepID=A0AAD4F6U7_9PEZI|nr:hypothetical protein NEMBOFW57_004442 [Staphylotrichum longicolle]
MASTPSNRIKLTPSNSPFLTRPSRSPIRPRPLYDSCLSLQRVVGATCTSPTGFDTVYSSFAYLAGGAVVVVDVSGEHYSQRFYRARPSAVPLLAVSPATNTSATPNSTPKANDSRNRAAASPRDSLYAPADWPESPTSKTWTSRERIKAATCLALSRDGRYLAVGETGYAPRVLIFNLQDASSDIPLVSISEHTFGVKAVAWSPDTRYLASLGSANDGFLYLWKLDPRTGAVKLFQQNRCTSFVKEMVWMGSNVITLGVRHIKVWRVDDGPEISPTKQKLPSDGPPAAPPPQAQKPLSGRNILLGPMLDATFCCALPVSDDKAIICSETGSVCLLDDANKQMKLVKVLELGFGITCISSRGEDVYIGGKEGQVAVISLDSLLTIAPEPTVRSSQMAAGLLAMGFLAENLVTIDSKRSIGIRSPEIMPGSSQGDETVIPIPGLGDPIVGIQRLSSSNNLGADFFTWSGSGRVTVWGLEGMVKSSITIPIEQVEIGTESDPVNQVVVVRATNDGALFIAGDKLGVLRIVEVATGECLLETKAHSSNCQDITVHEGKSRFLVASCGRDRTVQLFHRSSDGVFAHFQTLEFSAKVVQVLIPTEDKVLTCSLDRTLQIHDIVSKESEPDVMAAIPSRVISLRASPSSMTITPEEKAIFVSLLDRSVCQFDFASGRLLGSFKCNDEAGLDSVVLESLTYGQLEPGDVSFLLGISNTDKSVRLYDAQAGCFLDREWGHTEAINGVILIDTEEAGRKVVSVGEDGTIMVWNLEFQDPTGGAHTRDPSPEKTPQPASTRPPLRRVLSKAELAEFQRPSPTPHATAATPSTGTGRRSPPPTNSAIDDTPSRRASSSRASDDSSPPPEEPDSPKATPGGGGGGGGGGGSTRAKMMFRRPSLPALGATPISSNKSRKNSSSSNRRGGGGDNGNGNGNGGNGGTGNGNNNNNNNGYGFGTLSMATEQTCRQLRAYRKKLAGADAVNPDMLAQLDAELRLTAAALGERAIRSRITAAGLPQLQEQQPLQSQQKEGQGGGVMAVTVGEGGGGVSEMVLSGLLDQYSERLVSMLDEKLRLRLSEEERDGGGVRERPRTAGGEGPSSSAAMSMSMGLGGAVCEEPGSA